MLSSYDYRIMFRRQRTDNSEPFCSVSLTMLSAAITGRLPTATEETQQAQEEVHEVQEQPECAEQRNAVHHI